MRAIFQNMQARIGFMWIYRKTAAQSLSSGRRLVIGQVPEVGIDVKKLSIFAPERLQYPFGAYVDRNADTHAALSGLDDRHSGIGFFSPGDVFCADGMRCIQADDQGLFYSDDDHLSLHGSRILAAAVVPELMTFLDRQDR